MDSEGCWYGNYCISQVSLLRQNFKNHLNTNRNNTCPSKLLLGQRMGWLSRCLLYELQLGDWGLVRTKLSFCLDILLDLWVCSSSNDPWSRCDILLDYWVCSSSNDQPQHPGATWEPTRTAAGWATGAKIRAWEDAQPPWEVSVTSI